MIPKCYLPLVVVLAGGCTLTPAGRIRENASTFQQLARFDQQLIQQGRIETDFTPEMVYLALGHPSKKESTDDEEIWNYDNYYSPDQKLYDSTGKGEAVARILTVRFWKGRVRSFRIINE